MSLEIQPPKPRRVIVTGHNIFWKGYLHAFDTKRAIVENDNGELVVLDMFFMSIRFEEPLSKL